MYSVSSLSGITFNPRISVRLWHVWHQGNAETLKLLTFIKEHMHEDFKMLILNTKY